MRGAEARSVASCLPPRTRLSPRSVDDRLGRGRVDQRDVAGSGRLDDVLEEEPHALAVAWVEVGVDQQLLDGLSAGQVELDQPLQQRVLGPGDIGEPAVPALRRERSRCR